jgi:hypothetical protein
MVEPDRPRMTKMRLMRFACRLTKKRIRIHTLNIFIVIVLPRQQWLQERAKVLRYKCV